MKYVWGIILFMGGFFGAVGSMSTGGSSSNPIDFETATVEERTEWLQHEASEIERGLKASLPSGGGPRQVGFRVKGSEVNVEQRRIDVSIQMTSYGVMKVSQSKARKMFTEKTCPTYMRSTLHDEGVVISHTVLDSRGGKIIKFLNSPQKCKRFS